MLTWVLPWQALFVAHPPVFGAVVPVHPSSFCHVLKLSVALGKPIPVQLEFGGQSAANDVIPPL
jgi:hypothetical protein